ncbi:GntR family transcriptional regulator [Nocardioides jishulii]|uniref:GntR family transcriptional regulator n=1 Tax=Nocardioides jishulii TaxID=2575440 RepID=A0A4V5TKQ8_9ACTN|nr:GntR family transcriptional regulator [Nocardioides jishulii]QCX28444.1 GntR family transcriptional regulator [Nocardioides jishulii]TKI64663.1 GntR family transcriptional regulator [Nocardioides jishulii]
MGQTVETARELKHVVVREHVRNLVQGAAPGTPAPSERELVSQFGVARMTVRQALDALVVEGLLERMPGRGTFVARPRRTHTPVASFTESVARRGQVAETVTLLARREQAGPGVARALEVAAGSPVIHWRRLRRAGGEAICIQDVYLAPDVLPGVLDSVMPESLYEALCRRGLRPTWSEDSIRADLATDEERDLLDIGADSPAPVLRVSRRALHGERVVEVSRSAYRSDRHTLYLQLGPSS